jgi:hypothetical protein
MNVKPIACFAIALLCFALPILPSYCLAAAAIPMILFVPGYVALHVVDTPPVDRAERAIVSIALSIAMTILLGLLLNQLHMLDRFGWSAGLALMTLCLFPFTRWERSERLEWHVPLRPAIALAACASIALVSVVIAKTSYARYAPFHFSEFSMVTTANDTLTVALTNHEKRPVRYAIVVSTKQLVLGSWGDILLGDAETWQREIRAPAQSNDRDTTRIDARLLKLDDPRSPAQRVWAYTPATRSADYATAEKDVQ